MWLPGTDAAAPFGTVTFRAESMAGFSAGLEPSREGGVARCFGRFGHESPPKQRQKGVFGRRLLPGKQDTNFNRSASGGMGVPL